MPTTDDSPPLAFLPTPAIIIGPENVHLSSDQSSTAITSPGQSDKPFYSRTTTGSSINGFSSLVTSPNRQALIDPASRRSHDAGSPILYPASFIDQSRALLDQQRRHFDQERRMFDQERAMWDTERRVFLARIEELERLVVAEEESQHHGGRMMASSSSGGGNVRDRKALSFSHGQPRSGGSSEEMGEILVRHSSQPESTTGGGDHRFWEGSSSRQGVVPSRVFTSPKTTPHRTTQTLPTISEGQQQQNGTKDDDNNNGKEVAMLNRGIDISLIDHDLDGITLKTSAVPASILSKLTSPTSPSHHDNHPSEGSGGHQASLPTNADEQQQQQQQHDTDTDSNLTRNAGHTPKHLPVDLPPLRTAGGEIGSGSSGLATPTQTTHLHRPSLAATSENSRTNVVVGVRELYNNNINNGGIIDEDPALHSPLTLPEAIVSPRDARFLEELDSRLREESRKSMAFNSPTMSATTVESTNNSIGNGDEMNIPKNEEVPGGGGAAGAGAGKMKTNDPVEVDDIVETPEPEIKLRFKRSMNFGSAFGSAGPGLRRP
ncbi:MAG: hypothetical protein M1816_007589 [Peltula sp. TS41687]|nr:MAG: hypothetical protein M1816_007589 [Peltula sp. TS41687]